MVRVKLSCGHRVTMLYPVRAKFVDLSPSQQEAIKTAAAVNHVCPKVPPPPSPLPQKP